MTITIKNQSFELKNTFRSHIIYESITGKAFSPKGLTDILTYFYSTIMAANLEATLTFEEFIDEVDAQPTLLTDFVNWLSEVQKVTDKLTGEKPKENTPKAKKKNRP